MPDGTIRIEPAAEARTLAITDNGAGLTAGEIHEYLSTIGGSGTRDLRERLRERDRALAVELIGQFGIGILSAFIVAERVEITTRASLAGAPALRWTSDGGKHYRVEPAERDDVGTTVVLHLKPDHSRYLGRAKLHEIVQRYADFIGLPVFLGDDTAPANAVDAPWHRTYRTPEERHAAFLLYWEGRFKEERSLRRWPAFTDQNGPKALTETVLRSACRDRVSEATIREVSRRFERCDTFLEADAKGLAKELKLGSGSVGDAQEFLREHLGLAG